MKRKTFSKETKLAVVYELQAGKTLAQVCREQDVSASAASRWQREYNEKPTHAFAGRGVAISADAKIAELERTVGRQHMQIEFLKKVYQALQQQLAKAKNEK